MDSATLTQQGIDAYKAGNKEEAVRLLSDAVRANRENEDAWLYLGAALEDVGRKRQAFQRVLEINPNNEKAKNALARLDAASTGPKAGPSAGSTAGQTASKLGAEANARMKDAGAAFNSAWKGERGFKVPGNIEGAPAMITVPEIIKASRVRIDQAIDIFKNQNYEQIVAAGQTATMWDSVFIAGVGVAAMGAAQLFGGLIGWVTTFFVGGLGGLIWPFVAAIVSMGTTAAGFAAGVYASKWYLDNQKVPVSMKQHSMYYAMIFFPLILVNALTTFLTHALGFLNCFVFPLLLLVSLIVGIYGLFLLWQAFNRVYGAENNRGLITAAISVGGWIVGSILAGIVGGIFGSIMRAIFRVPFTL